MDSRLLKSACLVLASACVAFTPMGCKKAPPVTLACNASAPAIFPGEPVNLTATPGALSTKKNVSVVYTWTGEGVTGNGTTATVNTASLAPGAYTVKVGVKEGKKGKEGLKPGEAAECSTGFTVKEFEPPTISCSSAPSTIKPGEDSTITAVAMSPQNRPLTYSYTAAAGTITGTATTAAFSSAGAPAGPVGITCKVADDKGHTASGDTTVTIVAPPPPPLRFRTFRRSAPLVSTRMRSVRPAWTTKPRLALTRLLSTCSSRQTPRQWLWASRTRRKRL